MKRLTLAPQAQRDIDEALRASETGFGAGAANRYRRLIAAALRDLRRKPDRAGVRRIEGVAEVFAYHLRGARRSLPREVRVANPRHLIAFRFSGEAIEIVRFLHESMDLPAHLPE